MLYVYAREHISDIFAIINWQTQEPLMHKKGPRPTYRP